MHATCMVILHCISPSLHLCLFTGCCVSAQYGCTDTAGLLEDEMRPVSGNIQWRKVSINALRGQISSLMLLTYFYYSVLHSSIINMPTHICLFFNIINPSNLIHHPSFCLLLSNFTSFCQYFISSHYLSSVLHAIFLFSSLNLYYTGFRL